MIRVLGWLVRKIGPSTLLALGLLFAALSCLTSGMLSMVEGLDPGLAWQATIYGLLVGWIAGRSRLHWFWSSLAAMVTGAIFILLKFGRMTGPLWILLLRSRDLLIAFLQNWRSQKPFDTELSLESQALQDTGAGLVAVYNHASTWLQAQMAHKPIFDPVAASLLWSVLIFLSAAWAGWVLRRKGHPILAVTPAGLLLASLLNYTQESPYVLILMLASVFFLMVLTNHSKLEKRWIITGIDYSTEVGIDTAMAILPVVTVILSVALIVSSISVAGIVEFTQSLTRPKAAQVEQIGSSVGLSQKPQPPGKSNKPARPDQLPRQHLLGSGPELSQRVVMTVRVAGMGVTEPPGQSKPVFYWRSLTYDQYTGLGWLSLEKEVYSYKAGEPAIPSALPQHRLVLQEVHGVENLGGIIYQSGELVTANEDFQIAWRPPANTGLDEVGGTIRKNSYQVKSLLPEVDADTLRNAGVAYPDWVAGRYLQLPSYVPNRVIELAKGITRSANNPYDKARLLETYLRAIPYTLDIPEPPQDRDVVDYFLFDLRRGYCDYYATAMVVMARSVGVPARLATGYASGRYDSQQGHYIVTEADAHSWVEIYFPGAGWIPFEPTAVRPEIARPAGPPLPAPSNSEKAQPLEWFLPQYPSWQEVVIGAILLLILILVAWQSLDTLILQRVSPNVTVQRIYNRLRRTGRPIATSSLAGDTPNEFSQALSGAVGKQARIGLLKQAFYSVNREVSQITALYNQIAYSPRTASKKDREHIIQTWKELRGRLWLARLIQKLF
ncbi:MAG: transglutaminaseTgpA domain-containing protein [Omnitrophica WOR_2 bacterium]